MKPLIPIEYTNEFRLIAIVIAAQRIYSKKIRNNLVKEQLLKEPVRSDRRSLYLTLISAGIISTNSYTKT